MGKTPNRRQVKKLLAKLRGRIDREECYTCDSMHGFLMQIQLDIEEDMGDLFEAFQVPGNTMHACLACTPCPPGETYSEYILKQEG